MRALLFPEGGEGIGLGHLRRTTALVDAMTERGWDCRFCVYEPSVTKWLADKGYIVLPASRPLRGRIPNIDYTADIFVIDSYKATNSEIIEKVRRKAGLILAFDDQMNRSPVADVILSTGITSERLPWPEQDRVLHLLGPRYHPLPGEFLPLIPRKLNKSVGRIFVMLGGSGHGTVPNIVVRVAQRVFPGIPIDWVAGPFSFDQLEPEIASTVQHHDHAVSVRELLLSADLAITGSGQTLFELAATGTPGVGVILAENQKHNLDGLAAVGAVLSAGQADSPDFPARLEFCLRRLNLLGVREDLSQNGQELVDGRGAFRIEEALTSLLAGKDVR